MPFPNQTPRVFARDQVESLWPDQRGCYGLFNNNRWVYVGKGDIRQRLLDHLNGDNPEILANSPTHWVDVVTPSADLEEKRLILEYQPICNKRLG